MKPRSYLGLASISLVLGKLKISPIKHYIGVLTWHRIILFGHDGEMENDSQLMHPDWAKDGSILVVRKIKQFVPEWNRYTIVSLFTSEIIM